MTGNGTYSANLHSLKDGSITSALAFTDTEGNTAAATGNAVTLDTDKTEVATLVVADTADHVINDARVDHRLLHGRRARRRRHRRGHLLGQASIPSWSVSVPATAPTVPTCRALDDGSITSALAFAEPRATPAAATGNPVTLDTDKTEVATLVVADTADHVINNTKSTSVSFTVAGLDDGGTGTVAFSDGVNPNVVGRA